MDPAIKTTRNLLSNGNYLFSKSLKGVEPHQLHEQPGDANPLIWILGHLAYCRVGLLALTGVRRDLPWKDLFARSTSVVDAAEYPSIEEIVAVWDEATEELKTRLPELTEEQLDQESPRKMPVRDPSLRTAIAFMAWHESYHLGQLAYVRKWLGLGSLIDDQ